MHARLRLIADNSFREKRRSSACFTYYQLDRDEKG